MKKQYIYFLLFIYLIMGCSKHSTEIKKPTPKNETNSKQELILDRIKAMTNCNGKGVDVDLKESNEKPFKGSIWVNHGECVIMAHVYGTDGTIPVPSQCNFRVNKNLDFALEGEWDGKCLGARHTIIGTVTFYNYEFTSDVNAPLVFMMSDKGYQYIQGKGKVKDLASGKVYELL
jgi:hypothetical protein